MTRPLLETLEPRLVLSASPALDASERIAGGAVRVSLVGGALNVEGTDRSDRIQIVPTRSAGVVRVIANSKQLGAYGPVSWIDVAAGAGNDSVIVDPRITLPARLDGGSGNDTLRGGSGPNALHGGAGDDTLVVNPERDTFDGGVGRTRSIAQQSLGVIQVGPSASGPGLRRLAGSHRFSSLSVAGPAIVGPADLRSPRIVELLKESYQGGHTVSLAGGTEADANALAGLLGDPRPVDLPDNVNRADLVAFRRVTDGRRSSFEVSVLLPVVRSATTPAERRAGNLAIQRGDRTYLARVFTPTPRLAASPLVDDPSDDLTKLATAYTSSSNYSDPSAGQAQIYLTVFAARSFTNKVDFFYVSQEVQATSFINDIGQFGTGGGIIWRSDPNSVNQLVAPVITQPTPLDNPSTTSYTTGVNVNFGATVGWNEDSGFNASIGGGVSLEDSQTITVPPISISYLPNLAAGTTNWIFVSNNGGLAQMTTTNAWIWQVPFSNYRAGQTVLPFRAYAVVGPANSPADYQFEDNASVPLPFGDVFALETPLVTGVSAPTVAPGGKFTISGSAFYPFLVESVLIGGQPLNSASYSPVSDTQIEVVVPNMPGNALPVVVKTSQGLSNANVTINIAGASQVSVQALPITAVAGQAFANLQVATVTDSSPSTNPAGYAAAITWGDGATSAGTLTATGPGTFKITGAHTYANPGTYTFSVEVTDPNGIKGTATGTATVSPPSTAGGPQDLTAQPIAAVAGRTFTNATIATFTDSDFGVVPSDFTAAIDWGDGIVTPVTTVIATPAGFTVLGTHLYTTAGNYTFRVQVTDSQSRKALTSGTATVSVS